MVTNLTSSDPNIFDLILDPFEKLRIYEGKVEIVKILIKCHLSYFSILCCYLAYFNFLNIFLFLVI